MPDPVAPVRKRKVAKRLPGHLQEGLSEGDTMEISISANIRVKGSEAWVRVAATTEVRPGEEHTHTGKRLQAVIEDQLGASTESLVRGLS